VIIGGTHTQALGSALRGLDARRKAHEHNIANVETPNFRAREVSFEGSLKRAIASGRPSTMGLTTRRSVEATRPDGNNVRLDREVVGLEQNALEYRLMTQAINHAYGRLRASLGR